MSSSMEKLDLAIRNFCTAATKLNNAQSTLQSSTLQESNAYINVINSFLAMPSRLDELPTAHGLLPKSKHFNELLEYLPPLLLKLISDISELTNKNKEYWYGTLLQSVYMCFRSLRVQGLLQVNIDYFYELLKVTSDCLTCIQSKETNVTSLLLLLRIIYACLSSLSIDKTSVSSIVKALVPYFKHETTTVQISARNAAQFLIPLVDETLRHHFILTSASVRCFFNASGKDMPISSTLKLLLTYGRVSDNCGTFLREGVFQYAYLVMFKTARAIEKQLAFSVILMLSLHLSRQQRTVNKRDNCAKIQKDVSFPSKSSPSPQTLSSLLTELDKQAQMFIATLDQNCGKEAFESFKKILDQIEGQCINSSSPNVDELSVSESNSLQSIIVNLLEVLATNTEYQVSRYANLMAFECWECLKKLGRKTNNPIEDISQLIDKDLTVITMYLERKSMNEVTRKSLSLCFDILEDVACGDVVFGNPLLVKVIKKYLVKLLNSNDLAIRQKVQLILCALISDSDTDLFPKLCVPEEVIKRFVQRLKLYTKLEQIEAILRRIKSLANVFDNRTLLRRYKILPILENLSEQYTGSDIETPLAELICSLLSDPPDDLQEETSKVTAKSSEFYQAELTELLLNVSPGASSDDIPQDLVHHASQLCQLMSLAYAEFHRVLYSNKLTDLTFLVQGASTLEALCNIYEENDQKGGHSTIGYGKQIVAVSKRCLPEMVCVSFKALKDGFSDSLLDHDRVSYFKSFFPFFTQLHFVLEQWSRMDFDVKSVMVDYGAFHLLLNELHTAPTAKAVLNDDIMYCSLTTLYNVILDPALAKRFRIAITQRLFDYFLKNNDIRIRCLVKFFISCIHMLLSRSELGQVCINMVEADLLARCLNGVDSFFGGYDSLITTVENLACNPKHSQIFVDSGIVSILKSMVLNQGLNVDKRIFRTLLHLIPEPDTSLQQLEEFVSPLCNSATKMLTSDSSFMKLLRKSDEELCKGLLLLLSSYDVITSGQENIQILYKLKRYADCSMHCKHHIGSLISEDNSAARTLALLYQAKSRFCEYNHELMERMEQTEKMPGFEFKKMMRLFCNSQVVEVIRTLAKLKNNQEEVFLNDEEAPYMLDKALLDFLVFSTKEVSTCLLCHCYTQKLIQSHYIPKAILQEFVKAVGLNPGASVFIYAPSGHPSDWQYKSAAKATFSMLCKTCDGTVLSQDEALFKSKFFNKIYQKNLPGAHLQAHCIPYTKFLYRFAVGLIFRNIAPLYSSVCAEIGMSPELYDVMRSCRDVILTSGFNLPLPKIYLVILPSQVPNEIPQVVGWDRYVLICNTSYAAYKLLQPGQPMVPKRLFCFMVKIGIMIFVVPLDEELDACLQATCPGYEIKYTDANHEFKIPEDQERAKFVPQKFWWSVLGWARIEINATLSVTLSVKPPVPLKGVPHGGLLVKDILESETTTGGPAIANLLPPGFELNFENPGALPGKVIVVPEGHVVLLHFAFSTTANSQCFAALCRQLPSKKKKVEKHAIYDVMEQPYILIHVLDGERKMSLKAGFRLDETTLKVKDVLLGAPSAMKEMDELKQLIKEIPEKLICDILRAKGFRSLLSLLYWQELVTSDDSITMEAQLSLDTRCRCDRCVYCDMYCDVCLQPCFDRFEVKTFLFLGEVRTCSEQCSRYLFTKPKEDSFALHKARIAGHTKVLWGYFMIEDLDYPGLNTTVQFRVSQTTEDIVGLYSIPCGTKYICIWSRCIYNPFCLEYIVDEDFNAIEVLDTESSGKIFSRAEEKEMMSQLHEILVRVGIPYHYAALNFDDR